MLLPYGDWRPDVADYQSQFTKTAQNVIPRGDGYGPWPASVAATSALAAACRGFFMARTSDGSVAIFAGTVNKLYLLNNTSFAWSDVSLGGGTYSNLNSTAQWQFVQFNNFVIAVQANAAPQVYDLTSSSAFANLGGSPPQAAYVATVNRFLVLGNLNTGAATDPYTIQWSGLNVITDWDNVTNQSNLQTMADGGRVLGISGGEYGIVFQDSTIRRMTYAPGSAYIFQIDRITVDLGLLAPYSLTRASDQIFFLGTKGFHVLAPGGYPTPFGKERIDRYFLGDYDSANPQLVIGSSDPQQSRVYFAYKSANGTSGQFDKIICYDYALDRASLIVASGEYLATLAQPGVTLEGLNSVLPFSNGGSPSIEFSAPSFDDISNSALTKVGVVDGTNSLGFFSGANLEATIDTSEQVLDGSRRVRVKSFRPITDAATVYGSISARETPQAAAAYSAEQLIDSRGRISTNISTRLARAHVRIPAGTTWNYAKGAEPFFAQEGRK